MNADFRGKGASPTNHSWYQSSRVIAFSCGIKISAMRHLALSQSTRVPDGQTDRQNYDSQDCPCICSRGNSYITTSKQHSRHKRQNCWRTQLSLLKKTLQNKLQTTARLFIRQTHGLNYTQLFTRCDAGFSEVHSYYSDNFLVLKCSRPFYGVYKHRSTHTCTVSRHRFVGCGPLAQLANT